MTKTPAAGIDPKNFKHLSTTVKVGLVLIGLAALFVISGIRSLGSDGIETGFDIQAHLKPEQVLKAPTVVDVAEQEAVPVTVDFRPSSAAEHVLARMLALPLLAIGALILLLLKRIFDATAAGEPFVMANAHRLRYIGMLFAVAYTLASAVSQNIENMLAERVVGEDLVANTYHLSFAPMTAGIVLFALASVFEHGVKLREDSEATI